MCFHQITIHTEQDFTYDADDDDEIQWIFLHGSHCAILLVLFSSQFISMNNFLFPTTPM